MVSDSSQPELHFLNGTRKFVKEGSRRGGGGGTFVPKQYALSKNLRYDRHALVSLIASSS